MRVHHSEKVAYNYFFLANKIANKNFKIQPLPSHPSNYLLSQLPPSTTSSIHFHIFKSLIFQHLLQNSFPNGPNNILVKGIKKYIQIHNCNIKFHHRNNQIPWNKIINFKKVKNNIDVFLQNQYKKMCLYKLLFLPNFSTQETNCHNKFNYNNL